MVAKAIMQDFVRDYLGNHICLGVRDGWQSCDA